MKKSPTISQMPLLETLQGQLEQVVFANEETQYAVAKLKVEGNPELVTVVGPLAGIMPGEVLELSGAWETHPKYGTQFRARHCTVRFPVRLQGIEKYLGSGLIKGIGQEMAKRLVEKFGEKTLEVIERDPEQLLAVEGIGEKRLEMIRKAWEAQKEIREVMVFLQGHGVSAGYSGKIFQQYGRNTIQVMRENPYRLTTDVFGIGFVIADGIAEKVGVPRDSLLRAEAGIVYALEKLAEEGHVYGLYSDVVQRSQVLLGVDNALLENAVKNLVASKRVIVEDLPSSTAASSSPDRAVYLTAFYGVEKGLSNRLKALMSVPVQKVESNRDYVTATVQKRLAIILSAEQWSALETVLASKVAIVTGGPGTGKTTLVRAMLAVFEGAGKVVLMAAPTGRAAKRLSEVTGREAKTIHRLLSYNFRNGGFQKNEQNPLDGDVVIVDEASMVDVFLMHHLVRALPATATLILVGDVNQLPPVGPGNVLRDMIDSGRIPAVYLTDIFRQARDSLIVVNAHRINEGEFPSLPPADRETLQDFYFIEQEEPEKVLSTIEDLCCTRIPRRFNLDPLTDIQVLTPMHRGTVGTENLNRVLQAALNPGQEMVERLGRSFKLGDKVMQIRNNYDKEVFNGDIGRIAELDKESQTLRVEFDGTLVDYDFSELDELVLAYAVSVHKSQGSEYRAIVLPVLTQHFVMLQRNLIYTGITRARQLVVLIGTKRALAIAIKNDRPQQRLTRLSFRLREPQRIFGGP